MSTRDTDAATAHALVMEHLVDGGNSTKMAEAIAQALQDARREAREAMTTGLSERIRSAKPMNDLLTADMFAREVDREHEREKGNAMSTREEHDSVAHGSGCWHKTIDEMNACIERQDAARAGAPEGARVAELCEALGHGRVMQIAAELWRAKDPHGALTVGPCLAGTAPAKADPRDAEIARLREMGCEVEYVESGTFQGGEEDVFNSGIKRGEACIVLPASALSPTSAKAQGEQDG